MMSSQDFLYINIGVAVIIILMFLIGRGKIKPPSRLRLRTDNNKKVVVKNFGISEQAKMQSGSSSSEKNLNAIFIYNSHTWDAHEVLGIPAGSSEFIVRQAYEKMCRTSDPTSREFFEAAYQAIRKG